MSPDFILLCVSVLWAFQLGSAVLSESTSALSNDLPKGYNVFVKAPPNAKPPKVRKPPYLPISDDCPGLLDSNGIISKNNLCGDLNRGFVPRNPMGQYLLGQPYPFELIKNKTLQFLSTTLPHLKEEIEAIPKVARFVKPSEFFENHLKRYKRQAGNYTESNTAVSKASNGTGHSIVENVIESKEATTNSSKLARQNVCEGNALCQTLESLNKDGLFSKSFLGNVMSAVGNVASTNTLVSLLDQYLHLNQNESNRNSNNNFGISHLLSSVSSIHSDPSSATNGAIPAINNGQQTSMYSPLLSIVDYLESLRSTKDAKVATKRKTPTEPEDLLPEGPEKPMTPCMSTEEYISPTYARNYQGVWKYVVQIPNEGYFTQTIQQTTCLKSKCDLIEGSCRESPRWVSLLVAEIFYPDVYFPVNQIMPMLYKQQMQQANQQQTPVAVPSQQSQSSSHYQVVNSNHNQAHKRPHPNSMVNQLNKLDLNALASILSKRNEFPELHNVELLARRARSRPVVVEEELLKKGSESDLNADREEGSEKKHCDGYDKIGCYIVRVYYDWFLVNGSCKCWKSANSGLNINETIKRIFIGKWKK